VEATLEEVTVQLVPAIEALRVQAAQLLHSRREALFRRLDHEVEVVAHEAVRVTAPRGVLHDAGEQGEEFEAIVVVEENELAPVPAGSDVEETTGRPKAWLARHVETVGVA
jgi:hypothetical protein